MNYLCKKLNLDLLINFQTETITSIWLNKIQCVYYLNHKTRSKTIRAANANYGYKTAYFF